MTPSHSFLRPSQGHLTKQLEEPEEAQSSLGLGVGSGMGPRPFSRQCRRRGGESRDFSRVEGWAQESKDRRSDWGAKCQAIQVTSLAVSRAATKTMLFLKRIFMIQL